MTNRWEAAHTPEELQEHIDTFTTFLKNAGLEMPQIKELTDDMRGAFGGGVPYGKLAERASAIFGEITSKGERLSPQEAHDEFYKRVEALLKTMGTAEDAGDGEPKETADEG